MDSRDILGGAGPGEGDEFMCLSWGTCGAPWGMFHKQSEEPLRNWLEDGD